MSQAEPVEAMGGNDLEKVMPSMNLNLPATKEEGESNLITDESLLGIYGEIMTAIKADRDEVDHVLGNFVDMVLNGGDATSSSKEALVNLLKLKVDQSDKMTKVADLMTRLKLKERDTFPRYLAAKQENHVTITAPQSKRALLEAIAKQGKRKDADGF